MATSEELVRSLAILAAARNPIVQIDRTILLGQEPGPPSPTQGGDTNGALVTLLQVLLRADPRFMVSIITVPTPVASETYTTTINSVAHDYVAGGGDGEKEILEGIRDAINGGVQPVTAVTDDPTTPTEVIVTGTTAANFTMAVSATGAAVMAHETEATSVDIRIWGRPKPSSAAYYTVNQGEHTVDANWLETMESGPLGKVYIEIVATDGKVVTLIGPCATEATS